MEDAGVDGNYINTFQGSGLGKLHIGFCYPILGSVTLYWILLPYIPAKDLFGHGNEFSVSRRFGGIVG